MKSLVGTGEGRARKSVLCRDECESVSGVVQHIEVLAINWGICLITRLLE